MSPLFESIADSYRIIRPRSSERYAFNLWLEFRQTIIDNTLMHYTDQGFDLDAFIKITNEPNGKDI